jgi:MarR family transcriptional regulator for hemolysin
MTTPDTRQLILSITAQLSRLAGQALERKLTPLGITYQEFSIAGLLMGDEATTQKDLAERLGVRAATLSVAISKLADRGIVQREACQTDRRVNYLRLIPGKKIDTINQILLSLEQELCTGITAKELQITGRVLSLLINNLNRSTHEATSQ